MKTNLHTQEDIVAHYHKIIAQAQSELNRVKQRIATISTLRILLFLTGAAGVYHGGTSQWQLSLGIAMGCLVPFLLLMRYHNRLFARKAFLEKLVEINRQEIEAQELRFDSLPDGEEFVDPAHLYSYDLDIFGPRSLFQYLNRTCTPTGKRQLAAWLNAHLTDKEQIEQRQEAVRELAPALTYRQHFRVWGLLHKGAATDVEELRSWGAAPSYFRSRRWMRRLPLAVGATNGLCLLAVWAGLMSASVWGAIWMLFVTVAFVFTQRITKIQAFYGKKLQILATYNILLRLSEEQQWQAPLLCRLKERIARQGQRASDAVKQLNQLTNELDQRNNVFMLAILNGTFFWELRQMMRIERWKEQHAGELMQWLEALGEIDALCSMATFAYNHPHYCFPAIWKSGQAHEFVLRATRMGHPLMDEQKCVTNPIDMDRRPAFIIITGANMAGKSTYLRTVGTNYLLACTGMPVCAEQMTVCPAQLVTSLRTTDSLAENESYFFAELKRLKMIIDKLRNGEQLFIVLDEILKGTNSVDKQKGSLALVKQLIALQANGIIATHDLLLGTLIDSFPKEINNYCFEADIHNDELTFAYTMRKGVAQNMNACFLMKKMGIAVTD